MVKSILKLRRKLHVAIILPIKWKYQKMRTIETIVYPTPKVLLEELEKLNQLLPKSQRMNKEEFEYYRGQAEVLQKLLDGTYNGNTQYNK